MSGADNHPSDTGPFAGKHILGILVCLLLLAASASSGQEAEAVRPTYDDDGELYLPEGYLRWIFVGSSLGLSYNEGGGGQEMFHHTLMEPTAYQYFRQHGEFREGTMLALLLHGTGEGVLPSRRGRFASTVHAVEMAVKDSQRVDETWAYYNFGGRDGLREKTAPLPATACHSCHVEHAAYDNVFVQFYPLLVDAAPPDVLPTSLPGALPSRASVPESTSETSATPLALAGLDPVQLLDGREELGKPEIVMEVSGYRYQFVSEPSRRRFAKRPERFTITNDTCPVVPGAPIDPSLFAVHDGRIYAFATGDCLGRFEEDPGRYLNSEDRENAN